MYNDFDEYVQELESKVQEKTKELDLFDKENYTKDEAVELATLTACLAVLNGVSEIVTEALSCVNDYLESK